jgi:hypothetical protein
MRSSLKVTPGTILLAEDARYMNGKVRWLGESRPPHSPTPVVSPHVAPREQLRAPKNVLMLPS